MGCSHQRPEPASGLTAFSLTGVRSLSLRSRSRLAEEDDLRRLSLDLRRRLVRLSSECREPLRLRDRRFRRGSSRTLLFSDCALLSDRRRLSLDGERLRRLSLSRERRRGSSHLDVSLRRDIQKQILQTSTEIRSRKDLHCQSLSQSRTSEGISGWWHPRWSTTRLAAQASSNYTCCQQ